MPKGLRAGVHQADKRVQPARIGAPQRMGCTVFAGHQRKVQQLATAQLSAHLETGTAPLLRIDVVLADHDHLVHRQASLCHDQTGHQLGQRGNRQHRAVVLAEKDLARVLIHDQGDARFEVQGVRCAMQTSQLSKRGFYRDRRLHHRPALLAPRALA
jgi:hypothetical protein